MNELFLITTLLLLTGFFAILFFRFIATLRKGVKAKKKDETQVDFIVGTFHELIGKLKEKEKELEELRKKAEERADVIESYNEFILQSVPSGVVSFDRDLVITKVNASAERMLGLRAGNAIGMSYTEIFREPLKGILDGRIHLERGEIQYRTNSGRDMYIGLTLTPLLNSSGQNIGHLMVFTDLTELKSLEAQAELRDRLSSLGEMAAGMAHELRNPMAVIAGYTKMLSKKIDPSLHYVVDSVAGEVAVMDRIIGDFLSFAKPTEMNLSTVDLSQLLRTCVANSTREREDIAVQLNVDGIPPVAGDEILLRQAFTNLIVNAVEAMPQGGNLILGYTADTHIIEIILSDSGHGIQEKIRDKVFLPFYTTKDRGTGLGLAIVHKIVVSHRGSISLESNENGTSFRVRLPVKVG